jgi:hypothetical protein
MPGIMGLLPVAMTSTSYGSAEPLESRTAPAETSIPSTRVRRHTSIPDSANFSGVLAMSLFSSLITSPM